MKSNQSDLKTRTPAQQAHFDSFINITSSSDGTGLEENRLDTDKGTDEIHEDQINFTGSNGKTRGGNGWLKKFLKDYGATIAVGILLLLVAFVSRSVTNNNADIRVIYTKIETINNNVTVLISDIEEGCITDDEIDDSLNDIELQLALLEYKIEEFNNNNFSEAIAEINENIQKLLNSTE